jgi:hypothetical protein
LVSIRSATSFTTYSAWSNITVKYCVLPTMPSIIYLAVSAAAMTGLAQLASAQTNITASACVAESVYSDCNRNVADTWRSCINNCNGNGDCIVDCGCTAHQQYINCMAHSCWNQVCLPPLSSSAIQPCPSLDKPRPIKMSYSTSKQKLTLSPTSRSTPANTNSSSNNTSPYAPAPPNQSPSGQPQTTHQTAAPAV